MQELDEGFSDLYKEICLGRSEGYEKTDIISRSEDFFVICDEATGLAEKIFARKKPHPYHCLKNISQQILLC